MDTPKKVLLVGGTGTLGREVAGLLHGQGHKVRIMTRTPEKINNEFPEGVEIVKGDLITINAFQPVMEAIDIVIASAHSLLGKGKYASEKVDLEGHIALIDAAKKAGVQRFIYISVIGASREAPVDFWRTKYKVEEYLKTSEVPYTIIRSSAFMETHILEFIGKPLMTKGKVTILGNGMNPTNFISVIDLALLIRRVLETPETLNQVIEIGGPDNISRNDIAALYENYTGKKMKVSHLKPAFLHVLSALLKPIHPGISRIMKLSAVFDKTDQTFDPRPTLEKYPVPVTSVEDFIKKNIEIVADNK